MKLTIVLTILFLGAVGLLVIVLIYPLAGSKLPILSKIATSQDMSQAVLSMSPSSLTFSASGSAQILINVDTKNNTIGTAQFEIGYDPSAITVTQVSPGDFFPHPQVLLDIINADSGRVSFAETTTGKEQKGNGTLAILTIWTRYPILKNTTLSFYPKTSLMHLGETTSLIASSSGATILFPVFRPQVASGAATPLLPATNAAVPQ